MGKDKMEDLKELFIGLDKKVYVDGKGKLTHINFDNAATTPPFRRVMKRILESSEYYGSIARGDGQKSQYSSDLYDESRKYILDYFNAPEDQYTAIFINNTTEGLNRLSNILIDDKRDIVITTRMEHHSNDLPWRGKCDLKYVEVDNLGRLRIDQLKELLDEYSGRVKYVTVSGASNVTGYINDIRTIASYTHKCGAKLIVDGAQLVPHKKVSILGDVEGENIDFLVFSAHKMYAPFGGGAIIGLREEFDKNPPDYKGGGTVEMVLDDKCIWLGAPSRNEAGSPNFFGALAIMEALKQFKKVGFETIEENEKKLLKMLIGGMKDINKVILYGDNDNIDDRLGILVFNILGISYENVGEMLANIRAISVRQGGFCSHPYTRRILGINDNEIEPYISEFGAPGMVRVSLGMYNTKKEVEIFLETVEYICKRYKRTILK